MVAASKSVQVIHKVNDAGKNDEPMAQPDGNRSEQTQQHADLHRQDELAETTGNELDASHPLRISLHQHARVVAYSVTDAAAFGLLLLDACILISPKLSTYRHDRGPQSLADGCRCPPTPTPIRQADDPSRGHYHCRGSLPEHVARYEMTV